MWKKVLIVSAVAAIAGSSLVYAQRAGGPDRFGPDRHPGMGRWQPTPEDMSAFLDARIAGMKAGLKLSPDQEKNWPAFESAYRDLAKLRMDSVKARHEAREQRRSERQARRNRPQDDAQKGDRQQDAQASDRAPGRDLAAFMERRAEAMTAHAAAYKKFADAAGPLYQSLDQGQKRRFAMLAHVLQPRPMRFAHDHGRGFGPGERGFGDRRRGENGFGGPRFGALDGPLGPMGSFAAAQPPAADPGLAALAEDEAELTPPAPRE
jgi:hypothetical protein